ncbi:CcmD family protein [Ferruginibacter yonginensis]|uniref:CcmD family protein n=1 Tax=Ferruginibacter yonginensis TaxID=1310416 RepID=A0ABV8QUI2_9BACT
MNNTFNKFLQKITAVLLMLLLCVSSFAQANNVEMADTMRSNGKIYVVVTVCVTILLGLFLYVFLIDRKISKIEKEQH